MFEALDLPRFESITDDPALEDEFMALLRPPALERVELKLDPKLEVPIRDITLALPGGARPLIADDSSVEPNLDPVALLVMALPA